MRVVATKLSNSLPTFARVAPEAQTENAGLWFDVLSVVEDSRLVSSHFARGVFRFSILANYTWRLSHY
jgi:hypothetical protein